MMMDTINTDDDYKMSQVVPILIANFVFIARYIVNIINSVKNAKKQTGELSVYDGSSSDDENNKFETKGCCNAYCVTYYFFVFVVFYYCWC